MASDSLKKKAAELAAAAEEAPDEAGEAAGSVCLEGMTVIEAPAVVRGVTRFTN